MHTDEEGFVFLVPMALKNCLVDAAQYMGESIKGQGKKTWTQKFKAGIMVPDPMFVHDGAGKKVKAADADGQRLFVPSDGKVGGGKRVWKTFPVVTAWSCEAQIVLLEKLLIDDPEVVESYLDTAGKFVGLGFFRPARNGYWGRYSVEDFKVCK